MYHQAMFHIRRFLLNAILFATVITAPRVSAQPALGDRNIIFYFDISNMSKDLQASAVSTAEMLIQRKVKPEDRMAVMVSEGAGKVTVKQDLTKDHKRVLETVRHIVDNPAGNGNGNSLAPITAVLSLAEAIPGEKTLFYFARTVDPTPSQAEWKSLRDRAADSRIALYIIDTPSAPAC